MPPLGPSWAPRRTATASISAVLTGRSYLQRSFRVATPAGVFAVEYGRGPGEAIHVDGRRVAWKTGRMTLAPRIDFRLGEIPCRVEVEGILTLRGFRLTVAGRVLYAEGTLTPAGPRSRPLNLSRCRPA